MHIFFYYAEFSGSTVKLNGTLEMNLNPNVDFVLKVRELIFEEYKKNHYPCLFEEHQLIIQCISKLT